MSDFLGNLYNQTELYLQRRYEAEQEIRSRCYSVDAAVGDRVLFYGGLLGLGYFMEPMEGIVVECAKVGLKINMPDRGKDVWVPREFVPEVLPPVERMG